MASDGSGHPASGPYFTIDLHLHTNRGSADSNLSPKDMIARAQAIGIGAVCITEHDNAWDLREIAALAADSGVIFLRGMEVTTEMGHIGVFGLNEYVGGIYKLRELRKVVDKLGGIMVANHPFRYKLDPRFSFLNADQEAIDPDRPETAARLEIFEVCDAVEALNGACSEEENLFALKVARTLGLAEVADRAGAQRARAHRCHQGASDPRRPRTNQWRGRALRNPRLSFLRRGALSAT
jgi:hypothetical protein